MLAIVIDPGLGVLGKLVRQMQLALVLRLRRYWWGTWYKNSRAVMECMQLRRLNQDMWSIALRLGKGCSRVVKRC